MKIKWNENKKKLNTKNKKIILGGLISILSIGTISFVLIYTLKKSKNKQINKNDDNKSDDFLKFAQNTINASNENDCKKATQKLYGLDFKATQKEIDNITNQDLKTQYNSANALYEYIFYSKKEYVIKIFEGKEKNTGLREVLFIFINKDDKRTMTNKGEWPNNKIDTENDKFAVLITFFLKKPIKIEDITIQNTSDQAWDGDGFDYTHKKYYLIDIYFKFKNTNPSGKDFRSYNAFVDSNNVGKKILKNYLLSLKLHSAIITEDDLTGAKFVKGDTINKKGTGIIEFQYAKFKTSHYIKDFNYQSAYASEQISIKSASMHKIADEITKRDIITSNLPRDVNISAIEVSNVIYDETSIKITFNGGSILTQYLYHLSSYEKRILSLLESIINNQKSRANILLNDYDITSVLRNEIGKMSSTNAKNKLITFLDTKTTFMITKNVSENVLEIFYNYNMLKIFGFKNIPN